MSDEKYTAKRIRNEEEDREFVKQIDRFISKKMKPNEVIRIGTTPFSMRIAGAPVMPIVVSQAVIENAESNDKESVSKNNRRKHTEPHNISYDELKKLPESLRVPLMVCSGSHKGSLAVVTSLKNREGKGVYISVELNIQGKNSQVNKVTTISEKKNIEEWKQKLIKSGSLLAINKNEATRMYTDNRVQFPESLTIACFDNSIAYTDKNVKPLKEILQNILPEGEEKPMNEQNINLSSLDPAAAEIIKQLQAQLQQQSAENAALKNEMAEVRTELAEVKAEVSELKAEVREQGSRIDVLESDAEIVKAFTAAMSETKSFEQTMAEVQSVTKQITHCEKAEFLCFDSNENKFFSSEDGKTRNWQDSTEQLGKALASSEISFSDESRTKAYIPVAGNDGKPIGVLVADKADGFSENDLKHFPIGGDIMNTIDLAIKKEQNHLTAVTDNLTHLKNRDGLAEYQKTTLLPNAENKNPVNIIMCDIDHFKSINDTYGHDAGDIILKNVAKVLSEHTRSGSDCAFRMGGEEMVCVLNCSPTDAIAAAERLRKAVENTVHTVMHNGEPTEVKVTISVGIHEMQTDKQITAENVAEVFDEQFKFSDNAVYAAKETGRNRVVSADNDTMKDYLVSRAAEAIIEANSLPDSVQEVKENILKDSSLDEINEHLLTVDTPLAERVCGQIAEFTAANDYFAEKNGGTLEADNETVEYITDFMSDENRSAFESAVKEANAQTPKEKLDIIKEKFPEDYSIAEISNTKEECEAEFEEMSANADDLKDKIQDAVQKAAEITQNRNKGGDAI